MQRLDCLEVFIFCGIEKRIELNVGPSVLKIILANAQVSTCSLKVCPPKISPGFSILLNHPSIRAKKQNKNSNRSSRF